MSKHTNRSIIEIVRVIILEEKMNNTLLREIVLAITHIKNLRSMRVLERSISPAKIQNKDFSNKNLPNFHHFCILNLIVYIFFYKKKCILKSAKWDTRALKGKLVRFDGNTIYKIHIKDWNKVIKVKNLQIFKDILTKAFSTLPDFDRKPIFDIT